MTSKKGQRSAAPTTTGEQDLHSADVRDQSALVAHGQRRINILWEVTQAVIAVSVTITTLIVTGMMAVRGNGSDAAFLLLSNAFFVVISTYLARTNHTKVGGVGQRRGE